MQSLQDATLVAGKGIEGDRYFVGVGTFSPPTQDPGHQVTLIESEEVEKFNREHGLEYSADQFRRNLITKGVPLDELVDVEFEVGETVLRGIRLCEPCAYLSGRTDRRLPKAMLHRAGLRAEIVSGGRLSVDQPVNWPAS